MNDFNHSEFFQGSYIFDNGDGWSIAKFVGFETVTPVHRCSKPPHREHLSGSLTGKEKCLYCKEAVPDEIQALVTLHNWGIENG